MDSKVQYWKNTQWIETRGDTSSNFRYPGSPCEKNWTQLDLRLFENEGSKRFKINEKVDQLDRKLREN